MLKRLISTISIIFFNSLILFIFLNLLVNNQKRNLLLSIVPASQEKKDPSFYDKIIGDYSKQWFEIYKKATNKSNLEFSDKDGILNIGIIMGHSVLEYTNSPKKGLFYNVGFENIRANNKNFEIDNKEKISKILKSGESIWAFGGSTTYGWLVYDNETWPAYLENLNSNQLPVINFGTNGSDFNYQVQHLQYLLRKGYKPKKVIFLVGLNELGKVNTNLSPVDQFTRLEVIERKYNFKSDISSTDYNFRNFVLSIPIVNLFEEIKNEKKKSKIKEKFESSIIEIDNSRPLDIDEQIWLNNNGDSIFEQNKKFLLNKYISYYEMNLKFLKKLSKGFDFEVKVFLQPIAFFDLKNNPFLKKGISQTPKFKTSFEANENLREQIMKGNLDIVDISDVLKKMKVGRYTDTGHYTPLAHKKIAESISNEL